MNHISPRTVSYPWTSDDSRRYSRKVLAVVIMSRRFRGGHPTPWGQCGSAAAIRNVNCGVNPLAACEFARDGFCSSEALSGRRAIHCRSHADATHGLKPLGLLQKMQVRGGDTAVGKRGWVSTTQLEEGSEPCNTGSLPLSQPSPNLNLSS